MQAVAQADAMPLLEHLEGDEDAAAWLPELLAGPVASPEAVTDFLAGLSASSLPLSPAFYGSLAGVQVGGPSWGAAWGGGSGGGGWAGGWAGGQLGGWGMGGGECVGGGGGVGG